MRALAAFVIAPMIAPVLALAYNVMVDDVIFHEFILGLGAFLGYGVAAVFGLPAYLLYFRMMEPIRTLPFVWFTLACLLGYCVVFGTIMVSQSGLGGLLSSTFIGYGVVFFLATSLSVTVFYLIAFKRFGGRQSTG